MSPTLMPATFMPATTAAVKAGERMLTATLVPSRPSMTATIASLIALEVVEPLCSTARHRSAIPIVRVIPIVDVTIETTRPMKPRPSS
jgi:hypothetical protein